jgi:proteasome lid subunit RPN8/RPN11
MRIAQALIDEIVAHALEDAPNECCGMIAARDGHAVKVHRARNAAASPLRYEIDGMEQYRLQTEIEDAGLDLGAIYHSHTRSDPVPSQTDVNLARFGDTDLPAFPGTLYVIVGVKDADTDDVRAWDIDAATGTYTERPLEIAD